MPRTSSIFVCQQCGYQSPTLLGKCPECGSWGSLVEQIISKTSDKHNKRSKNIPNIIKLSDIEKNDYKRISTKIDEFDRVLGGGVVLGSVVLLAGDPGIGKSTLLSHLAINMNESKLDVGNLKLEKEAGSSKLDKNLQTSNIKPQYPASNIQHLTSEVLYIAGEESPQQIRLRIERINPKADVSFIAETDVDSIIAGIESIRPKLVIVDSIQALETTDLTATPGSVSQVRECAHRLQKIAKKLHIPIFLIGHVTKEGTVAGPKTLEHVVDVVLFLEGDSGSNFRVLRGSKNRFGPIDEVGIFEMDESGLKEVANPSEVFLQERVEEPGSTITVLLTGLRPILVEIQSLVTKTNSPVPRRVGTGFDSNRLQLLAAVLQKRIKLSLWDQDVFVNVAGGVKVSETAADLAVCAAIISSFKDKALAKKAVFIGEVGLLGEVRSVRGLEKRIKEAKKLGFEKVFSSQNLKNLGGLFKKRG
jgi:DNA repair protein RadA/Sms